MLRKFDNGRREIRVLSGGHKVCAYDNVETIKISTYAPGCVIPAEGSVEKVIARSPQGDAAICKLLYGNTWGLLRSARNDGFEGFSTLPEGPVEKSHIIILANIADATRRGVWLYAPTC